MLDLSFSSLFFGGKFSKLTDYLPVDTCQEADVAGSNHYFSSSQLELPMDIPVQVKDKVFLNNNHINTAVCPDNKSFILYPQITWVNILRYKYIYIYI